MTVDLNSLKAKTFKFVCFCLNRIYAMEAPALMAFSLVNAGNESEIIISN